MELRLLINWPWHGKMKLDYPARPSVIILVFRSRRGRQKRDPERWQHACMRMCSVMSDSAIPWIVALQAPLFMALFRQEYWSGLPFSSPGIFPTPGIKPTSLESPALARGFFTSWTTSEARRQHNKDRVAVAGFEGGRGHKPRKVGL